ncbi:MAG: DALR domain-containing protein, partial [Ilumatobacteraceae bacterium]
SNLLDLIEVYDPRAYRMVLLQSHYRSPVGISADGLEAAGRSLAGLDSFIARTASLEDVGADAVTLDAFRVAMNDDLDTPKAMALLFDTMRQANTALDEGDDATAARLVSAVKVICGAVGLRLVEPEDVPVEVLAQAAALDAARAAKDYEAADAIRAELQNAGWQVETTRDGTTVRR